MAQRCCGAPRGSTRLVSGEKEGVEDGVPGGWMGGAQMNWHRRREREDGETAQMVMAKWKRRAEGDGKGQALRRGRIALESGRGLKRIGRVGKANREWERREWRDCRLSGGAVRV
ncbi:hypothetical protein C8Q70DRAFT_995688 [Cubamyces menziesii]|nr:hypothetical protein C8Q70DRAFT_995688 [Cubamyces menziesii]